MGTVEQQLEVDDSAPPALNPQGTEILPQANLGSETSCERAIGLVVGELKTTKDFVDRRAKELASFIVPGLVEGHFTLNPERPNEVHERIHGILGKLHEQKKLPKEIAAKLFGPASEA